MRSMPRWGRGIEVSGGSAANTVAGIAALGGTCGFIGQVADDQLGEVFAHDIRARRASPFDTAARAGEPTTARCLIFVTPDGQRTMNTFLGASQFLPAAALDRTLIAGAAILYLEGYLWDPEEPRAAMRAAIEVARDGGAQGRLHAVSDVFCIARHGGDFRKLIDDGLIDILFANEAELAALAEIDDFEGGGRLGRGARCRCWWSRAASRARSRSSTASAPRSPPSRSTASSTPPARATCSRRASSHGQAQGEDLAAVAQAWARSARPRSSATTARGPRST